MKVESLEQERGVGRLSGSSKPRNGALYQSGHTSSDEHADLGRREGREPLLGERAVQCDADVGGGIKECAVQVEQRSEEHTSELQSQSNLVCRLLLEKKNNNLDLLYDH